MRLCLRPVYFQTVSNAVCRCATLSLPYTLCFRGMYGWREWVTGSHTRCRPTTACHTRTSAHAHARWRGARRAAGRRRPAAPAAHAASVLSANACSRPRGWKAERAATPPSAAGARSSRPIATARNCESGRGHLRAPAARALQRAWRDGARARRCGRPPVLPAAG